MQHNHDASKVTLAETHCCELCGTTPLQPFDVPGSTTFQFCPQCGLYQKGAGVEQSYYAADYHTDYGKDRARKLRTSAVRLHLIEQMVDRSARRILDVGCSLGFFVEEASARGWDAHGVDLEEDVVAECTTRGLHCQRYDGLALPFPDASFDVLTAWHVIEHVYDVSATLTEWGRVLRPGGLLVIATPDASSPRVRKRGASYRRFWAPEHIYTFEPATLSPFLARAGFTVLPSPLPAIFGNGPILPALKTLVYDLLDRAKTAAGMHKAFQVYARKTGEDVPH